MKKWLLSVGILGLILAGCSTGQAQDKSASVKEETKQVKKVDTSKMTPWVDSNIQGVVTKDTKTSLKDDFYLSVNKDWLAKSKLPAGYSSNSSFVELTVKLDKQIQSLVKNADEKTLDGQLTRGYYELFLDWDTRNKLGVKPLQPFVKQMKQLDNLADISNYLQSEDAIIYANLVNLGIGFNEVDSSKFQAEIGDTSLLLGDSAEYQQLTENGKRIKTAVKESTLHLLTQLGYSKKEAEQEFKQCLAFEKMLAPSIYTTSERNSADIVQKMIHPVSISELQSASPTFPLVGIFTAQGYAKSNLINLQSPKWLDTINKVYTEKNVPYIKSYLLVHGLQGTMSYLDEANFRKAQEISQKRSGTTEKRSDEEIAVSYVQSAFPDAVDRLYVHKYLNENMKKEIYQICQEMIANYESMLQANQWLSAETKTKAINKLKNIQINSVYPDKWRDDSIYQFKLKKDGGNLFAAHEAYLKADHQRGVSMINTTVDPDIWYYGGVTSVNAYYNPTTNSMNILAGILGGEFYQENSSKEEKYAGISFVIGHELSHAFDSSGAQYDEKGNVNNWWTEQDQQAFTKKTQIVIDYLNQVKGIPSGKNLPGELASDELIADMGSMRCLLNIAKQDKDFDYQKFFKKYAQVWKDKSTIENIESQYLSDPHPLSYLRGNVVLQQFQEFYDTFDIQKGDGMYLAPEKRIAVW